MIHQPRIYGSWGRESAVELEEPTTSPVLTRQDHWTSSGLRKATARTNGSSSTRGTDTPANGASGEPDAIRAISDRAAAEFMTFTGADLLDHDRSGGPSADAVSERAATGVTTSTGANSRSNDPSEAPVSGGASAGSMTSTGADPRGQLDTDDKGRGGTFTNPSWSLGSWTTVSWYTDAADPTRTCN